MSGNDRLVLSLLLLIVNELVRIFLKRSILVLITDIDSRVDAKGILDFVSELWVLQDTIGINFTLSLPIPVILKWSISLDAHG